MKFGSLFAGIGGIDLGLERAGMTCRWQVECDPFASRVLAKHWPDVTRWGNVKTFVAETADERRGSWGRRRAAMRHEKRMASAWVRRWRVDLIAGGFPCQDISFAGKGAGLDGEKSGLWREFARVVRVLRPRYVLMENVGALLVRGLDAILGTLAEDGYDAEWTCLQAADVGAPHLRDRVFIVAHLADAERLGVLERGAGDEGRGVGRELRGGRRDDRRPQVRGRSALADADGRGGEPGGERSGRQARPDARRGGERPTLGLLADADREGEPDGAVDGQVPGMSTAGRPSLFGDDARTVLDAFRERGRREWWGRDPADGPQPGVDELADGVPPGLAGRVIPRVCGPTPNRTDKLRCLGNAVVPQVAEFVGRRILEHHHASRLAADV